MSTYKVVKTVKSFYTGGSVSFYGPENILYSAIEDTLIGTCFVTRESIEISINVNDAHFLLPL